VLGENPDYMSECAPTVKAPPDAGEPTASSANRTAHRRHHRSPPRRCNSGRPGRRRRQRTTGGRKRIAGRWRRGGFDRVPRSQPRPSRRLGLETVLPKFEPVSIREPEFCRETVWRGQRPGRRFWPHWPIPGDRDRAIRVSGGKAAESQGLFRRRRESEIAQDCVVAEAVLIGPVSVGIFPANREKNREYREKTTQELDSEVIFVGAFNDLRTNSLCERTGNFFRGTGNYLDGTGKLHG
jgi:hypothetical protein